MSEGKPFEPFASDHPIENDLVRAIRTNPTDDATRQVYADWLEQHGHNKRALYLRLAAGVEPDALRPIATPADAPWRAIVSRAPISRCGIRFGFACTRNWDSLAPTETDGVRHCAACEKPVYHCTSIDEARDRGARQECVAVDASLVADDALAAYDEAGRPPRILMGAVAPRWDRPEDVTPLPEPPKRGVLARVAGWFKR